MEVGEAFSGIAGPLGCPASCIDMKMAGRWSLPPAGRSAGLSDHAEHLRMGNHVTLIAGFRGAEYLFWSEKDQRIGLLQAEYPDQLDVVYTSNDGSFGIKGFVTDPLREMLEKAKGRGADASLRGGGDRSADHDERCEQPDQALRGPYHCQPKLHHGGCDRYVRRLYGAGDAGRQDGAQARLYRWPRARCAYHRLGKIPAPVHAVQEPGAAEHAQPWVL